jgi:hypothetical protein
MGESILAKGETGARLQKIGFLRGKILQRRGVRKEGEMLTQGKLTTGKGDFRLPAREIILCPHQPGNLKISREACGKRHLRSRKSEYLESLLGNDPFWDGFSICRNCSIGKRILREEKTVK